ncbi:MAG: DUF4430 domain-containing protein [Promethearchaeia archaeon]
MEKRKKYIIIAFIGSLLFLGLILYNFNVIQINQDENEIEEGDNEDTSEIYEPEEGNFSGIALIVDYNNGSKKVEDEINVDSGNDTVFDILLAYCDVEYTEYSNGEVFIEGIDGVRNKNSNNWLYWVNGEYAEVGAASYHVEDGDEIKWIYGDQSDENGTSDSNNTEISISGYSITIIISVLSFGMIIGMYHYRSGMVENKSF